MLSRLAAEFAAEIKNHDWSDAPYRTDQAGHSRLDDDEEQRSDQVLSDEETGRVKTNVAWVVGQVLLHADPNFDIREFAHACDLPRALRYGPNGQPSDAVLEGIRRDDDGEVSTP
ncbi:hypothetical protein [Leifsonia aquatica]|uniref:Uncharacterized protein n=2 Tax=Leifsonia aquatica TaxID=144185 RepID=U2T3K1_LEIAQ|nr:hypothetical protein [Leifsonia aquatica]ERK72048.1 hypothetical protein N136_01593 [Leifsonia aquatica ATCC 14665]MBB2965611.1 hypothetical protein [Leifsonia aquatica]